MDTSLVAPSKPELDLEASGKILLVGHPNVGKSVLFNLLSGSNVNVSNYPGTTVDLQHSLTPLGGEWYDLVDTPGARSLVPASEDEKVTQQCLLDNLGVTVVQVGDAKNLRHTLFLTTQLIELEFPQILALNMVDECREAHLMPDARKLSRRLGLAVCPTTAITGEGIDQLAEAAGHPQAGSFRIDFPPPIERAVEEVAGLLNERLLGKRGLALLYLAGDESVEAWIGARTAPERFEKMGRARSAAQRAFELPLALVIHQRRFDEVSRLAQEALVRLKGSEDRRQAWEQRIHYRLVLPVVGALSGWTSAYLLHFGGLKFLFDPLGIPRWLVLGAAALALSGWFAWRGAQHRRRGLSARDSVGELAIFPSTAFPLLLSILYLAYLVIGVFAAQTCVDFIENKVFASVEGGPGFDVGLFLPISEHFSTDGEMVGWTFFHVPWKGINCYLAQAAAFLIAPDNLLYQLFFGPPPAGQNGGSAARMDMGLVTVGLTYSIAIILPIVAFFFFIFGILEDSGYLPRIAMLTDKAFKRIGLNGKAVLPLILGLGCDTMATMTTRILETRKERVIAVLLLALAVPCSAQIGVISGVMARVSPISVFLFVVIILAQLILVGWLSSKFLRGAASDFIIEIPPIRVPLWRNVLAKTTSRLKWFLIEAVPLFLVGTFILFVVHWLGLIPYVVNASKPVVTGLLGLPEETTIGFILGFLRRDFGAVQILASFANAEAAATASIDPRQVLVAVTVITLFVPCLANYFMMVREQGLKVATAMGAFILPYAILVGAVLNQILHWVPADWLKGKL
ncbi:MAG: ferrous iron transporter B [Planctomycetes bacterium]|nr:ferrous iron transporter B [Planctomycetota bacterium]